MNSIRTDLLVTNKLNIYPKPLLSYSSSGYKAQAHRNLDQYNTATNERPDPMGRALLCEPINAIWNPHSSNCALAKASAPIMASLSRICVKTVT